MESSPLAAMQPPSHPINWGCRRDLPSTRSTISAARLGNNQYNYNGMKMKRHSRTGSDYFSQTPSALRGSSPTDTLTVDFSENFTVGQTPQQETPRRNLFAPGLFRPFNRQEGAVTPPCRYEGSNTPPIPSSSPCFGVDPMDCSPLPHKVPFSIVTTLPTPTPPEEEIVNSPDDHDMLSPLSPLSPPPLTAPLVAPPHALMEVQRPTSQQERRKPMFSRPSLARTKNLSTNTVTLSQKENTPLLEFNFGSATNNFGKPLAAALDEAFTESPPQERKFSNPSFGPLTKPRQTLTNILAASRDHGSPVGPIRKQAAPARKRYRRSLSMYENPADVMHQKDDSYTPSTLQCVTDVDESPKLTLPHFTPSHEPDSLPRINSSTMIDVLDGVYDHHFEKRMVVDCRFEYEYQGGHVDGAVNFCEREQLAEKIFKEPTNRTLLIFHCEYSAHRAPMMAKFVRQRDRAVNATRYPQLTYPEVYILDGGYSSFYAAHRSRCFPPNYLRMDAKEHEHACERGMNKLKQRSKLNRAQTFAFGQGISQIEDSPTQQGRSRPALLPTLSTISADGIFGSVRSPAQRSASY